MQTHYLSMRAFNSNKEPFKKKLKIEMKKFRNPNVAKTIVYFFSFLSLQLTFFSCNSPFEEETVVKNVESDKVDYELINRSILDINFEEVEFSQESVDKLISETSENEKVDLTFEEVNDFKNSMISYLTDESIMSRSRLVNTSTDIPKVLNEIMLGNLSDESSYSDFEVNVENAKVFAKSIEDERMRGIAINQIEQAVYLTKTFLEKYEAENSDFENARDPQIKCKWYQWACVGGATAAAVALIISSGGTAAALLGGAIVGGGTVGMVAMCCICKCRCSFTTTPGCRNA
jgi:hypothetical protein